MFFHMEYFLMFTDENSFVLKGFEDFETQIFRIQNKFHLMLRIFEEM